MAREVMLGIGSSMNPIRTDHIRSLVLGRQLLEETQSYVVRGLLLAVASDAYVRNRFGLQGAIKSQHRIAMANLAISALQATDPVCANLFLPVTRCHGNVVHCASAIAPGTRGFGLDALDVKHALGGATPHWMQRDAGERSTLELMQLLENLRGRPHTEVQVSLMASGMLDAAVAHYMAEHWADLFFEPPMPVLRVVSPARHVVIGLGGSYNPIHRGHVATLLLAREVLERDPAKRVVGLLLAVATEGWVLNKVGPRGTIKAKHRLAMANLAVASLAATDPETAALFPPQTECHSHIWSCASACYQGTVYAQAEVVNIMGTDVAFRNGPPSWRRSTGHHSVVVLRDNDPKHGAAEVQRLWHSDLQAKLVASPDKWTLLQHPTAAADHSSTRIREILAATPCDDPEGTRAALDASGMVDPLVTQYIVTHRSELFLG